MVTKYPLLESLDLMKSEEPDQLKWASGEDVQRVLEAGYILLSVLTKDEIEALSTLLECELHIDCFFAYALIGNISVT